MAWNDSQSGSLRWQRRHAVIVIGVLLAAVVLIGASVSVGGVSAQQSDPIKIEDWTDLNNVRNDLNGDYVLINELDETTPGYETVAGPDANGGSGFNPIGTSNDPFTGTFDGRGYVIRNLVIDRSSESRVGLFGVASASINRVTLASMSVTGSGNVGGLVGQSDFGTVSNSEASGEVNGSLLNVGGLVGQNVGGSVSNSEASGTVNGFVNVGGLVGQNVGGIVSNSEASGTVDGSVNIGELVGLNGGFGPGTIEGSYAVEAVTGSSEIKIGGLVREHAAGNVNELYFDNPGSGTTQSAAFGTRSGSRTNVTGLRSSRM